MTNNATAVLSYAIYMANKWSQSEARIIWGNNLGEHIWNKWVTFNENYGTHAASMKLLYELDNECLEKLVERANALYEGRRNRPSSHM